MKKIILAVSAVVILLSVSSVIAKGSGSGAHNKALKLLDSNDRDLGYLVTLNHSISGPLDSTYTTYDPTLDIFLTWDGDDGVIRTYTNLDIYFSQPNCTGEAFDIVQFEQPGQSPECNHLLMSQNSSFSGKMDTCKLISATVSSKFLTTGCENFTTTTVSDAYFLKSLDAATDLAPATPPFKVIEK